MSAVHRRVYAEDATLGDRVFDLLDTWLPPLRGMREASARLGSRWEEVSTPFVHERDGRVLSHLGVLEMTLVSRGEARLVGGIHGVCTLAAERRKGLYRALMEEALAWCDARYTTVELTTGHPEYYEPFGFRRVAEHRYRARVQSEGRGRGFRRMDLSGPAELERLDDLLERRAPVSRRLGVVRDRAVFKFNLAGSAHVYYSENLEAVTVGAIDAAGRFDLIDVVAPALPTLEAVLDEIPAPVGEVCFHFHPGDLDVRAEVEPEVWSEDALMVRGVFPFGDEPAGAGERASGMLPPSARH